MSGSLCVSVVLPVYDTERYIALAVESVLNQTFTDFELIIINDGSTDSTPAILDGFQKDSRVTIHHQSTNQGLIAALNHGCQAARGEFIAIMHADDVSLPDRFARQIAFLLAHPEVGIVGTAMLIISEMGDIAGSQMVPHRPGLLGWLVQFHNPLAHPTVMMRREVIAGLGFYDPDAYLVDDYDLWLRASLVTRLDNVQEPLLHYRAWPESATSLHRPAVEEKCHRLIQTHLSRRLGRPISLKAAEALRGLDSWTITPPPTDPGLLREATATLEELWRLYQQTVPLTPGETRAIRRDLARRLYVAARQALKQSDSLGFSLIRKGLGYSPASMLDVIGALGRRLHSRLLSAE